MNKARVISFCGSLPLLGPSLRKIARRYPEGSVTTIRNGHLAGYRWKRSHRYVSGYWLGHYELPIQKCLARELKPGDIFYDIGANAGFFSLMASNCVGPAGRVFAFEPLPENVRSIRSQVELNAVANVTVVQAAVSNREGTVEFSNGQDTSTAHIKGVRAEKDDAPAFSVRAVALDQFSRETSVPDFMKMDIEGAELMALKGACRLLGSAHPPKILIEFHGERLRQKCMTILADFGYLFYSLAGEPFDLKADDRHILCIPRTEERPIDGGDVVVRLERR